MYFGSGDEDGMTISIIIGIAAFYLMLMGYLAFEFWVAPLVDEQGNVIESNSKHPPE
jgi:hypothetical protein